MIRLVLFLCTFTMHSICVSDPIIFLDFSDQPDRTVRLINESSQSLSFRPINEISSNQGKKPIKIVKKEIFLTTTGKLRSDNSFSLKRTQTESLVHVVRAGKSTRDSRFESSLKGITLIGNVNQKGRLTFDDINGGNLPESNKVELLKVLKTVPNLNASDEVPREGFKIGDTFSKSLSVPFPIPGGKPITISMVQEYKLASIEQDLALFEISYTFAVDSFESFDMYGNGYGELRYNHRTKLQEEETTSWFFEGLLEFKKEKINAKISVDSLMIQVVQ